MAFSFGVGNFKLTVKSPCKIQGSLQISLTLAIHIVESGGGYHTKLRGALQNFPRRTYHHKFYLA